MFYYSCLHENQDRILVNFELYYINIGFSLYIFISFKSYEFKKCLILLIYFSPFQTTAHLLPCYNLDKTGTIQINKDNTSELYKIRHRYKNNLIVKNISLPTHMLVFLLKTFTTIIADHIFSAVSKIVALICLTPLIKLFLHLMFNRTDV